VCVLITVATVLDSHMGDDPKTHFAEYPKAFWAKLAPPC